MTTINKVILMGNIGKEPDVRYLENGKVVAKFPLATNENYKDRQGNPVSITEWHNVEVWDDLARLAEKYLRKGKMVYIEGKIRSNKYQDKETGQDRYIKYIKAEVMTFMNLNSSAQPRPQNNQASPAQENVNPNTTTTTFDQSGDFTGDVDNFDYSSDISPQNTNGDLPF